MRSGQLRHRVELQRNDPEPNEYGEDVADWKTFAKRWGNVRDLSGRELIQAQQVQSEVTTIIELRHMPELTPQHRVKFGDRIFDINSVINPDGRKIATHLFCKQAAD